jgi:hypothetical protein
LGIALTLEVAPPGFGLELSGRAIIGGKDLGLIMGLSLSPAGIPTNLAFEASSNSTFSPADLVSIANQIAGGAETIPGGSTPTFEVRPIGTGQPIRVSFALRDTPSLNAGFDISGALYAAKTLGGPLEFIAVVDIEINTSGIFIFGNVGPIIVGPVTLNNALVDIDLAIFVPSASFILRGEITHPWSPTPEIIDVQLNSDGLLGGAQDALTALSDVSAAWNTFASDVEGEANAFANDPIGAMDNFLRQNQDVINFLSDNHRQQRCSDSGRRQRPVLVRRRGSQPGSSDLQRSGDTGHSHGDGQLG